MKESPLENLRNKLEEARKLLGDIIIPNPKKLQENCERFIILRQEIQDLINTLMDLKVPIEPELVRLKEIDYVAKSNIKVLNKGIKNSPLISKSSQYPKEFWWWHIPYIIEEEKKKKIKKFSISLGIFIIIAIGLILIFTFYKSPEEEIVEVFSKVDRLIESKNYDTAENEIQKLLEKYPQNPEIFIKLGIIQEMKGSSDALLNYEKARKLYNNDDMFYLKRAEEYFKQRMLNKAEKDIMEILKRDKNHPQALYLLGSIYEEEGKIFDAISVYKKIEALGDKVDPQLMAMTKVRLGMLLQKVPVVFPSK